MSKTYQAVVSGFVPRGEGVSNLRKDIGKCIKNSLMKKKECKDLCDVLSSNQKPTKRTVSISITIEDEPVE